jgi:anion-transporting  ArsA/GET3 family ATPase
VRDGLGALFERRLLIVTGKGGTGKTSVAAVLGVLAARRGIETVVVEVSEEPALPALLSPSGVTLPRGDGRVPVRVEPRLSTMVIDPQEALTEYLELQIGVRVLVSRVIRNPGFQRLMGAAPGWRELITLGKIWHLETRVDDDTPRYGLVVVDAPATGHGLSFLSVPAVVLQTVRLGPLRRDTDRVQALLMDSKRTLVVPVTLPEELPVRETLELLTRVRSLGLGTAPVIANGLEPAPEIDDLPAVLAALSRIPERPGVGLRPDSLRRCVEAAERRASLQRSFLDELERELGEAPVTLPYLADGVGDRHGVEHLADALEESLVEGDLA